MHPAAGTRCRNAAVPVFPDAVLLCHRAVLLLTAAIKYNCIFEAGLRHPLIGLVRIQACRDGVLNGRFNVANCMHLHTFYIRNFCVWQANCIDCLWMFIWQDSKVEVTLCAGLLVVLKHSLPLYYLVENKEAFPGLTVNVIKWAVTSLWGFLLGMTYTHVLPRTSTVHQC